MTAEIISFLARPRPIDQEEVYKATLEAIFRAVDEPPQLGEAPRIAELRAIFAKAEPIKPLAG